MNSTTTERPKPKWSSWAERGPRVARIAAGDPILCSLLEHLVLISLNGLPRMFHPDRRMFCHSRRLDADGGMRLAGTSMRYGAIVLLGVHRLPEVEQRLILGGEDAAEFCARLVQDSLASSNLGNIALVAWAAAELAHDLLPCALDRLSQLSDSDRELLTVEWAWLVSAFTAAKQADASSGRLAHAVDRLLGAFSPDAGVFSHRLRDGKVGWRSHVACFADQVYPIQALARHHAASGHPEALAVANRCAESICRVQGSAGQWWWHYDARNGRVIEGYPVYSVHQDAMGPMALLDLAEAGGDDHADAIRLGLRWMEMAPEVGHSLIDDERSVIWRKVGRTDPAKLVRAARAAASRVHPDLTLTQLDAVFPARKIDFECRPYHLGWVLHSWMNGLGR